MRRSIGRTRLITVGAVAALVALPAAASAATLSATIDFEGLAEGALVDAVSVGSGISGDAIPGSVGVLGDNPALGLPNEAMVFDATCTPTETGGDPDLCFPSQGNTLIITEDGDSSDPDDADVVGSSFVLDFTGFGPGVVDVGSLTIMDVESVEAGGVIEAYDAGGVLILSVPVPITGDGGLAVVAVNAEDVAKLVIRVNGSAAIDNIEVSIPDEPPPPPPGDDGCTPGYWKQPHHLDSWVATGFSPGDDFDAVFGTDLFSPDITLLDALELRGNRTGVEALARHAVAGLLNAASPDVAYTWTIDEVKAALAAGDKDALEDANEQSCPLD